MKATQPRSRKDSMRRRGGPDNASCKFKGVRQRTWGSWVSEIRELNRGKRIWIGTFKDSESAAMAYDKAAIRLFGPNTKLNFPERLPQVSCPIHATAATSKDTLVGWKEIVEMQQGKNPPAMAHDKPAGSLFGAYAGLNIPESLPRVSCPVHATSATSKDALVNSKGIEVPEGLVETSDKGPIVSHDEVQGDNVGKNEGNLEERCDKIKENSEKIEKPEDLKTGVLDDIFKDILEEDLGLGDFWL
ncbi:hypothetical protein POM88_046814 [Heracleum sosnowskyi]|uniref:AP2/ERF domain-containing protein n=1 Tax=Heracleum sosnowskyi TaxID=360622 RepID=A0AAD8M507_9APIA|nr:hypothetical protein POM88_046814 [Heracleum sosnowskyi]